jgi:hypothetical protein
LISAPRSEAATTPRDVTNAGADRNLFATRYLEFAPFSELLRSMKEKVYCRSQICQ